MTKAYLIWSVFVLVLITAVADTGCSSGNDAATKKLVATYCGRCHHVPDPASLTKSIWEKSVMKKMAEYYKWPETSKFKYANRPFYMQTGTIPMTDTIWSSIQSYFMEGGLDEPVVRSYDSLPIQEYFKVIGINGIGKSRGVTAVNIHNKSITAGSDSLLLTFNTEGLVIDSVNAHGLISGIFPQDESTTLILDPGILDPHDSALGSLKEWNRNSGNIKTIKDQLARPVYLSQYDSKMFISEYGNKNGRLGEFEMNTINYTSASNLPGGYKSLIFDYDKDGNDEILVMFAQALEGVYVREVDATGRSFVPVLSFNPEWGISDMDTLDVNRDGWTDLVVVNGDNADYSTMPKDYHGVRVYLNNKEGRFEEVYNFPMHGATQVKTLDTNGDGFEDILVSAFFAVEEQDRLMLLINSGKLDTINYLPYRIDEANQGRWMVMDKGDADGDGDLDVIIGSFEIVNSQKGRIKGEGNQTDLLLLLNQSN